MQNYRHRVASKRLNSISVILFIPLFSFTTGSHYAAIEANSLNPQNQASNNFGYSIEKLTYEDVLANERIFENLYSLSKRGSVQVNDRIELQLYQLRNEKLIYYDNIPRAIIVVRDGGKETKVPSTAYPPIKHIKFILPLTNKPILCIQDPLGGTGWNNNPYHVISLEEKYYLKKLGQISAVLDIDKDGVDELIIYDGIWEHGLGFLSHAAAPGARIIFRIDAGAIVNDVANHKAYYYGEIERIDREIKKYSRQIPPHENDFLLSFILQKFLIYKLLGQIDQGWQEFNRDIRHYDDLFFFLSGGLRKSGLDKIPIDEIKRKMVESLEGKKRSIQ